MNRKLHNTLLALSTTGLLLVVGLLAATPAQVAHPAFGQDVVGTVVHVATPASHDASGADEYAALLEADIEARIEARARAFEVEIGNAENAREAIASTAAFIAGTATEAAIAGAFAGLQAEAAADDEPAPARREPQRKRASSRSKLALPYFSFAHGLRRNRG